MKRQVPIALLVAPALLVVAAVAAFLLVKPKLDESGRLDERIAEFQGKVDVALAAQHRPADAESIQVADLFRLTKALPDTTDMASLIFELKGTGDLAGVSFVSITPSPPVAREGGVQAVPISLSYFGNYYDLTDFLFRLRNLVLVRDGELAAQGRLFTLESLSMQEGAGGFPDIEAGLTLNAYVFDQQAAAAAPATPPAGTDIAPVDPSQEVGG